ncbi:restriction endonuclease subunit R [Microbacterium aerolatum]|uniref:Restriction endonuclease subunit R n=1 Tax=Microbacterium aerolatum TaxID=153731 RepID=A0A511AGZ6_9MICO|nr:restriction endonuclease subunit R [Microbacterium aerolatum]GEK87408.1 hypothetical protein MAE01_25840 [Microbacterium aerolatum]GGB33320.1 hypothetical protein GCM10007198_24800 [Microbacterium aerolatum]
MPKHAPTWPLAASAFNWTPDLIRAESGATEIAVGIVSDGIAPIIEVELGQLWRSFPVPSDAEAESLRDALAAAGGRVSIVGASIDDWAAPTRRRDDDERMSFLLPQLRAAHRLGATGVRLPIGQSGVALLERLLPELHDLDLVLFEEAQGPQTPSSPAHRAHYDTIAHFDDPHLRLLVDISMLMPALPVTYLDRLRRSDLPASFVDRLESDWQDPATSDAAVALLRAGAVPPDVHTMFMNLLVRFGRSDAADLRDVLTFAGAAHLKFWDLHDADDRVSRPVRHFASELRTAGFTGSLTSEWGGHEWLDDDAADMTRRHLDLVRAALTA